MIEQREDLDPLNVVTDELYKVSECAIKDQISDESFWRRNNSWHITGNPYHY